MTQSLSRFALSFFGALATLLVSSASLRAAILYEQDFEGETLGTIGFNTASSALGLFQVDREIAINGGTAGSSALVYSIDSSRGTQPFAMSFFKTVDVAHGADPSRLQFSVDIKVVGTVTTTPINLSVYQIDQNYEARYGIDANNDGDMTDGADNFRSKFSPTLTSGDGFVTASFLLDEGTLEANVYSPFAPIPPVLNAALPLRWGISFGSDGFGFDAGNSIAFDNIKIELVPEPSSPLLALFSSFAIAIARRRLQWENYPEKQPAEG